MGLAQVETTLPRVLACIAHLSEVRQLISDLADGEAHPFQHPLSAMAAMLAGIRDAWQEALETGHERPLKRPFNGTATRAAHLAAHRPGTPSKIDGDPELRAFIIARLDTPKFAEIVAEVRATFPPDRHTSVSALSRWWQREGRFLTGQS